MTENELRQKACACARSWLGRREADGSFRPIIDTYNSIRPLPGGYRMTYSDPWCAAFVSAVGWAVGLSEIIYPECSCDRMITLYQQHGRWCEDDAYHARPGDVVFYDWQDIGQGDNHGESDHVGLVVEDNGYYLTVIEGNHSDAVGKRTLAIDSQYIRGFGLPDYAAMAAADDGSEPPAVDSLPAPPADPDPEPETCAVTLPVLREGDESDAVRCAQRLLLARGYPCGGSWSWIYQRELPDGEFGPKTASSVRQFQTDKKLPETGKIDSATWAALITT